MVINAAKPTMARRPFQFSALGLQKALAKGSFLVNPLQTMQQFSTTACTGHTHSSNTICQQPSRKMA